MKITQLKVNHISNPVGYDLQFQTFSWKYVEVESKSKEVVASRVVISEDVDFQNIISDSGFDSEITGIAYELQMELKPRTRYYWKVYTKIEDTTIISSEISFFETGKREEKWEAEWLGITEDLGASPVIRKSFVISKTVKRARAYVTGLGLYECYINGIMQNDGYLQPGFNNYNFWQQYQTFDVTNSLTKGENVFGCLLGAGWYKGRFGVNGGFENNFGENYHLICELHIEYEDGSVEKILSDSSFKYKSGPICFSNIYDGEVYDPQRIDANWMKSGFDDSDWKNATILASEKFEKFTERFSIPVVIKEERKPIAILTDPDQNKILDMGQNMTGWLTFENHLPKGQKVIFKFVEILQDERICQENLLGAKQEFIYISDGKQETVRPHFTYFGFRYVQIEGFPEAISKDDFTAWNLYSDMESTGDIVTGNKDINQFFSNALWSQKDNFLEHPSDCPQRAERLGWTGDAQMYCKTASYNMYTPAFYRKYIKDVNEEQLRKNGLVPFIIPKIAGRGFEDSKEDECSAAWSDVATIVPWTIYLYYGDKNLLREEYQGMKSWVEYMMKKDEEAGDKGLWQTGFHFGDWLALDNPEPGPFGKTDAYYIASCYYYYSTTILAKAAKVLQIKGDTEKYEKHAEKIRASITKEYFDESGICKQDTQTAYTLAIYMGIVSEKQARVNGQKLVEKIQNNEGHLDTGFVGTSYICMALSKAGFDKEAYDLLLKEDYPGWLYQVKSGATTVWEAWDAIDEQGNLQGKPSLNHYAFGSVVEWLYTEACGIKLIEEYPGFEKILIEPKPDIRLKNACASVDTPVGRYQVQWEYKDKCSVKVKVKVPFAGNAILKLKNKKIYEQLSFGTYEYSYEEEEANYEN